MHRKWIWAAVFILLVIPMVGNAPPNHPVTVYGYVRDADGIGLPDGIPIVVKNVDKGGYANTTTSNGAYLSYISASIGDTIMASCSYLGESGSNTTIVQDRLLQICDISLPLSNDNHADANMDGSVNVLDLIVVSQRWGKTGDIGWIRADVNRDGEINVLDLISISQHWTG